MRKTSFDGSGSSAVRARDKRICLGKCNEHKKVKAPGINHRTALFSSWRPGEVRALMPENTGS